MAYPRENVTKSSIIKKGNDDDMIDWGDSPFWPFLQLQWNFLEHQVELHGVLSDPKHLETYFLKDFHQNSADLDLQFKFLHNYSFRYVRSFVFRGFKLAKYYFRMVETRTIFVFDHMIFTFLILRGISIQGEVRHV
mgnify:CR=1 FL=1